MASTTTAPEPKMSLKLFIDKTSNKVLYAEAGKDFVDFLLHNFMSPLGLAINQVFNGAITGGLATLFTSVAEDLRLEYLEAGSTTKAAFLNPNYVKTIYICNTGHTSYCSSCWSDVSGLNCPYCKVALKLRGSRYVAPPDYKNEMGKQGYVKGMLTYMITDDLTVKPLSSSSVTMMHLSQLGINEFGSIQETEVTLDSQQGMEMVKASLHSKTLLTDTFLRPVNKEK